LAPFHLEFLRTAVFILVIAALVQLEELYMKKMVPSMYRAMGIYLPLITTNCAILAVAFLAIDYKYNFLQSMVYSLGVSMGYTLAIILFAHLRDRMALAPIPKWFQGYPIAFITAALMSLAFLGFNGMFGL
jgi:electron transport complex protein RnfA